jgi:hypothetical protein
MSSVTQSATGNTGYFTIDLNNVIADGNFANATNCLVSFNLPGPQGLQGYQGPGFNPITNPLDNRILTSDGGTYSANAESNLTFDGNTLSLNNKDIQNVNNIDFYTQSSVTSKTGRMFFDGPEASISYYPDQNQDVIVRIGQQLYTRVGNVSGATISKGSAVKIQSATAGLPIVTLAIANHQERNQVVGLAADNIPNNGIGLVLNNGLLTDLNMASYSIGDVLYLSGSVTGSYVPTINDLSFNNRTNEIGYVVSNSATAGRIYVNINNEDYNLTLTDRERNILEGNVISTGLYDYSPGLTRLSATGFSISPVRGWIVINTYSYSTLPDVTNVIYAGATALSTPYLNTADSTYVLLNASASISYQDTFPTPQERREKIYLGKIVHPDRTSILNVNQTPDYDVSPISAIRDLWTPIKLINSGVIVSYHAVGTMEINTSTGTLWGNGIGWTTNQLNPNSVQINGQSPVTFQYRTRSAGSTASNTTVIDNKYWDNAGVKTLIGNPGAQSTNQRVYLFPTGLIRIQYGQKVYSKLTDAVTGVLNETFVENGNLRDNGILICIISVRQDATDLSNTSQAIFHPITKFGELTGGAAGLSTTTLQQAYDNSSQPEILTDSTRGAVSFRRGSAAETDHVIEVQNNTGTNNFFVDGNGKTTTQTIAISGLSSSTNNLLYAGSNGLISSTSSLTYDGATLKMNYQSGDEGGEMFLNKPVTNTSINTGVSIDIYQNKLRIFESGGSARGAYIDITDLENGVATNLAPYRYLYVTRLTTTQTIPGGENWANRDIIFNNQVVSRGISYNTSTGRATLSPGVYRISAQLAWSAAATYIIQYSCYDSSNNQLGPTVEQIQPTSNANVSSGDLDFIYTVSSTIDVKIRTNNNTTALSGEYIRTDLNTQMIIQQIG